MSAQDPHQPLYRSGAAARLAGVPVETLRIWERRYAVVGPRLSEGRQRLYSSADVKRLTLIKQLVDMGHPIGSIASLAFDVLDGMRATRWSADTHSARAGAVEDRSIRVALIGPLLTAKSMANILAEGTLEVVARWSGPVEVIATPGDIVADIALIDLATLHDADVEMVNVTKAACGAAHAIVLYRFAPSAIVRRMRGAGHVVARSTSDAAEIETLCLSVLRRTRADINESTYLLDAAQPAPRRFDEGALADLASSTTHTMKCECTRHLAELVIDLAGFERYSAECASRSQPDADLHFELQRVAGVARSIVEQALDRVTHADGR